MKKYLILLLALVLVCGCENKKETPKDTPKVENTTIKEEKKEDKGTPVEEGSDEEKRFLAINEYAKKLCEDKTYKKFPLEEKIYTETFENLIANYGLVLDETLFSCVNKETSRVRIDANYTILNKDVECPVLLEIDGCQPDVVEGEEEN